MSHAVKTYISFTLKHRRLFFVLTNWADLNFRVHVRVHGLSHAPITPTFSSGASSEIAGDYFEK